MLEDSRRDKFRLGSLFCGWDFLPKILDLEKVEKLELEFCGSDLVCGAGGFSIKVSFRSESGR